MIFPEDLKYTPDHEWIKITGDSAYVGVTVFAQRELGDIVFIDIQLTGAPLAKNEIFGSVEAVKTVSDLFMPVSGTITETNPRLDTDPELVNQDPYGDGWMVKIALSDFSGLEELLSAKDYKLLIGK